MMFLTVEAMLLPVRFTSLSSHVICSSVSSSGDSILFPDFLADISFPLVVDKANTITHTGIVNSKTISNTIDTIFIYAYSYPIETSEVMKMNAVEFTKWMAEQDITGADEKVVYYMAVMWIRNAKEVVKNLEEDNK